ncbi:MAG: NUDIX hydrolase [Candidatus Omnitrophica bacterium]|nr:NUDIX hydrolase [Candidatus Omnitrophota bacterium]
MTELQFASGGVVIKKEKDGIKVLLIKDSYGHWTWPKGHIEEGESPREAAVREISEETGLKTLRIIEELGQQKYHFTLEGTKIFKTVHVFLAEAQGAEEIKVQTEEIECARWFPPAEALETIEYEGSRELLAKGIEEFREKG